jgi:protein gp37
MARKGCGAIFKILKTSKMFKSFIQWCDYTHNFWHGCRKLGIECSKCYLYRDKRKYGQDASIIQRLMDKTFYSPLFWKESGRVFTCSYSDFFIEQADCWREDAWDVIKRTPWLTWMILTKRPERIKQCLPADWEEGWDNVWLGVSVGIQESFHRAKTLASIPSKIRFISAEPLLEELDFLIEEDGKLLMSDFQWVIIGGESGDEAGPYRYRPCQSSWIDKAVTQLRSLPNVAIFVKQMGSHLKNEMKLKHYHGGDPTEWPVHLRITEHPDNYNPDDRPENKSSVKYVTF